MLNYYGKSRRCERIHALTISDILNFLKGVNTPHVSVDSLRVDLLLQKRLYRRDQNILDGAVLVLFQCAFS